MSGAGGRRHPHPVMSFTVGLVAVVPVVGVVGGVVALVLEWVGRVT